MKKRKIKVLSIAGVSIGAMSVVAFNYEGAINGIKKFATDLRPCFTLSGMIAMGTLTGLLTYIGISIFKGMVRSEIRGQEFQKGYLKGKKDADSEKYLEGFNKGKEEGKLHNDKEENLMIKAVQEFKTGMEERKIGVYAPEVLEETDRQLRSYLDFLDPALPKTGDPEKRDLWNKLAISLLVNYLDVIARVRSGEDHLK